MLHRHAGPAVAGSYLTGAIAGALTSGTALLVVSGLLSPVPQQVRQIVGVCAIVLLLAHAVGVLCLELPQRAYQIPRDTFTADPSRAAFRFAFELGTGVRTFITAVSPYALAIVLLLGLPSGLANAVTSAALAALGYGLGRSVVVVTQSMRRKVAVEHPKRWLSAADYVALLTALAVLILF